MASTPSELESSQINMTSVGGKMLVMLSPVAPESLGEAIGNVSLAFAGDEVALAASDLFDGALESFARTYSNLHFLREAPGAAASGAWVLTAADFLNVYKMAERSTSSGCLVVGPEGQSLSAEALRGMANAIASGADLAVPYYDVGPREALVNSALLYPVSRAIFGGRPRFPLAVDLGMSMRMAARMATVAQKFTALNQNDAMMWPVAEALAANFNIVEVEAGKRTFPQPADADLNTLLARIASSLFTEVETYASFWQRARIGVHAARPVAPKTFDADAFPDVQPMLESFQLAYRNLHEVWSLVLPPNSLLALKRLSQMPSESFRMGDSLWARTVYDFILAYRLRTINRGHLLGALTPLYLAWVASHILLARGGVDPEKHVEEVALAFETDKAYLVSRWRWPDRFNP